MSKKNPNSSNQIFTDSDYNSNNGFSTYIWGPCAWHFLHIITFNYPNNPTIQQQKDYYKFFKILGKVLPCKWCRINYVKNTKNTKLSLKIFKNRKTLSQWLCNMHNLINDMLDKHKNENKTYDEIKEFYEHFRARCTKHNDIKKGQHGGCTTPLRNGSKSKTILKIVPRNYKIESVTVNKKCLCTKK